MSRYSFLLTRRWVGIAAVAVLVSLTCVALGYWQLTRYQGKAELIALVEANYERAPVPLTDLLPDAGSPLPEDLVWGQVTVTGEYVGATSLVLPQRPIEGSPADHVIAVIATQAPDGGTRLLAVDRGWYPTDEFADHSAALALPSGEVTLTVRLRAAEDATSRIAPAGQVYALAPAQVVEAELASAGTSDGAGPDAQVVAGVYGALAAETPTTAGAPDLLRRPSADLGSHLSYTMQWWVFAIGALVGTVILARREAEDLATPAGEPELAAARAPARSRRRTAEDEEDDLIDAQLEDQASETSSA